MKCTITLLFLLFCVFVPEVFVPPFKAAHIEQTCVFWGKQVYIYIYLQ